VIDKIVPNKEHSLATSKLRKEIVQNPYHRLKCFCFSKKRWI